MRTVGAVLGTLLVVGLGALGVSLMRDSIAHGDSLIWPGLLLAVAALCAGGLIVSALTALVPWLRRGHENVRGLMVVAVAVALGAGAYALSADTPIQRPDVSVTAAVARACAGQPIPEAGAVNTDGSTPNHLVVLDAHGAEQDWTGRTPMAWRPPTVGDVELVACVDAQDLLRAEEVCRYENGSLTTRNSAVRNVRVLAARTGIELASFSIRKLPGSCPLKKVMDQAEIDATVDWSSVEARLASLVRDGAYVDPDATPTPTPSAPVKEAREVTLQAAIAGGLASARGVGGGLEELDLRITSRTDESLRIVVKAGTYLDPGKSATQTMVVVATTTIDLEARATITETLDVACSQMHDDQPASSDSFTVRAGVATGALAKLLAGTEFQDAEFRIQQFAVWTITSNPTKTGYVRLGSLGVGSGPSSTELRQIKSIFRDAGIDPAAYRALK